MTPLHLTGAVNELVFDSQNLLSFFLLLLRVISVLDVQKLKIEPREAKAVSTSTHLIIAL